MPTGTANIKVHCGRIKTKCWVDPYLPSDRFLLWWCWEVRQNAWRTPPHHLQSAWQSSPWRPNAQHATGHHWDQNLKVSGVEEQNKNVFFFFKTNELHFEELESSTWHDNFKWILHNVNLYAHFFIRWKPFVKKLIHAPMEFGSLDSNMILTKQNMVDKSD